MAGDWFGSDDSVIASRLTSVQPSPIWMIVIVWRMGHEV